MGAPAERLSTIFISIILWHTGLMVELYKRKANTKCFICNKAIYRRPLEIKRNKKRVFCSMACYGISCRKEIFCVVCGKPILSGLNKKTCSRGCANRHRAGIQYKINRPRDKVKSQQAIKIRLLEKGEKVVNNVIIINMKYCKYIIKIEIKTITILII